MENRLMAVFVLALALAWHAVESQTSQRQASIAEEKLSCPVFKPADTIIWTYGKHYDGQYKKIAALSSSGLYHDGYNQSYQNRLNISSDGTLLIRDVTSKDDGFYQCRCKSDAEVHRAARYSIVQLRVLTRQYGNLNQKEETFKGGSNCKAWKIAVYVLVFVLVVIIVMLLCIFCRRGDLSKAPSSSMESTSGTNEEHQL